MKYCYNLFLSLLVIPFFIGIMVRNFKRFKSEFLYDLPERFGVWKPAAHATQQHTLWFHCASLGEVRAAENLMRQLRKSHRILVTTLTYTGKIYAQNNALADAVLYAPLDFTFLIKKFILLFKPQSLIIVETELWPGLITESKKMGLAVLIINARLSDASFPYYKKLRIFWCWILRYADFIAARSPLDARRFLDLGVAEHKIAVTGNLKYDTDIIQDSFSKDAIGFKPDDRVVTFASTRDGEEEIIFTAWHSLKATYPYLKLVIAPRHIERTGMIEQLCKQHHIAYALKSRGDLQAFDCLIVDTYGELQKYFSISDIIFVGGSLVDKGGQNPIEPASFQKPIVFGSFMQNFFNEAELLKKYRGAIEVKDLNALRSALGSFLSNPAYALEVGANALKAVQTQRGAIVKTLEIINRTIT